MRTALHQSLLATAALVALTPALAWADAKASILSAYQMFATSRAHIDSTITDENGKVSHNQVDFDTVHRIHATTNRVEVIVLPEGAWINSGKGWSKSPMDMSAMVEKFIPYGEQAVRSATNVTDDGATTWNGQPAHAYSADTQMNVMGMDVVSHSKMYINAAGQVIGSERDSVVMGRKTHSVQNIRYDDSIRISAP